MKKLIFFTIIILCLTTILGGAFYWYEMRPSDIRKNCEAYANSQDAYDVDESNNYYRLCLLRNGMKPESMFVGTDSLPN